MGCEYQNNQNKLEGAMKVVTGRILFIYPGKIKVDGTRGERLLSIKMT